MDILISIFKNIIQLLKNPTKVIRAFEARSCHYDKTKRGLAKFKSNIKLDMCL